MPSHPSNGDEPADARRAIVWLRLLKLLLSVVLLALGVFEAVNRLAAL